jgi:hypothetical protein
MGIGLAMTLIAVGGASIFWAMTRIVRSVTAASGTGRGYVEFAPRRAQNARSTESDAADDEVALLLAALERVTEERDKARQELMELEDRWSW